MKANRSLACTVKNFPFVPSPEFSIRRVRRQQQFDDGAAHVF